MQPCRVPEAVGNVGVVVATKPGLRVGVLMRVSTGAKVTGGTRIVAQGPDSVRVGCPGCVAISPTAPTQYATPSSRLEQSVLSPGLRKYKSLTTRPLASATVLHTSDRPMVYHRPQRPVEFLAALVGAGTGLVAQVAGGGNAVVLGS